MENNNVHDLHLIINMHENHLHFDIYAIAMDYIRKLALEDPRITEDMLEIESFNDITISKENWDICEETFTRIANEYSPFYANTSLADEEATPNKFTFVCTKVYEPNPDFETVNTEKYNVSVHIEWDDVDEIPEEFKYDS